MSSKDLKGYYKTLGVQSDAPASVIRAAYRALAMDLHPDRNPGKDTTAQFQKLQEAYASLSDEKLRQKYDADSSVPPASTASDDRNHKPLEPIVCSKCSRVSAQPRYKVFYTVYGYIFGATKKPHQGVFCSNCEIKVALRSSAITLVAGWWSIAGFFWTLQTLIQNLVGGQFNQQNAQLQGYQAMWFAQNGKVDLARAIATEALKIAEKATKEKNKQHAFKKNLGYEKVDPLSDLKKTLTDFINHFPANAKAVELKATNGIFNKRFVYQSLLLLAFSGLISGEVYRQERATAETERLRLERQGIEREKAAAIAAQEAEALRSMERPLPKSGLYGLFVDLIPPENPNRSPPLKVTNSPDANTLMKLTRLDGAADTTSIFIRAGETVEVAVPIGVYKAKIASGQTWYGDSVRFGPSTSYSALDAVFEFKIEGNQLMGHELTLKRVQHGNLKRLPLTASDF
jgi:hypothetical protein